MNETPRFSFRGSGATSSSTFVNRDFLVLFIGALIFAGMSGTTDTLGHLCHDLLLGSGARAAAVVQPGIVGAVIGLRRAGRVGRLFDKKTLLLATFGALMVDGVGVIGLRLLHLLPANGSTSLLVILVVNEILRTLLSTLLGIIFVSMLADTIDVQELNTGRRQEGIFAAALSFSGKATAGIGAIVAGFLLQQAVRWPLGPIRTRWARGRHTPGPGGRGAGSRCCSCFRLRWARATHHPRVTRRDPGGAGSPPGRAAIVNQTTSLVRR